MHSTKINISVDQEQIITPETQATVVIDSQSRRSGDTQEHGSCEVPGAKYIPHKSCCRKSGPGVDLVQGYV